MDDIEFRRRLDALRSRRSGARDGMHGTRADASPCSRASTGATPIPDAEAAASGAGPVDASTPDGSAPPVALEGTLGGCEQRGPGWACWCVMTPVESSGIDAAALHRLGSTLVLDLETGGLAGTPVFLIGAIVLDGEGALRVQQWMARDYAEEASILRALAERATRAATWVTFNGKTFDVPFLLDRALVHRVPLPAPTEHVDLLPRARRRWGKRFSDCRLTTLERGVLGRTRLGDVPGRDVPDLFHHFIRTGNARPLRAVLEHNRQDLLACLELLGLLEGDVRL